MDKMLLTSLAQKEFEDLLCIAVKKAMQEFDHEKYEEKFLSATEARKFFNPELSPTTLWRWSGQGLLTKHYFGKKAFYKYSEILEAAKTLKKYRRTTTINYTGGSENER
jgi:hypothetical protein